MPMRNPDRAARIRPCNAVTTGRPAAAMDPDARGPGIAYPLRHRSGREFWAFVQDRLREPLMASPLPEGTPVRVAKHSGRWVIGEVPSHDTAKPVATTQTGDSASVATV